MKHPSSRSVAFGIGAALLLSVALLLLWSYRPTIVKYASVENVSTGESSQLAVLHFRWLQLGIAALLLLASLAVWRHRRR